MKIVGTELVRQVWMNTFSGQMLISIPKHCGLLDGDFVLISKVEPDLDGEGNCKRCGKPYGKHTLKELYNHGLFGVKK